MPTHNDRSWIPFFILLSAIWGASFLFIKVADRALSPTEVALARVAVGAIVLLAWLAITRQSLPRRRVVWGHLALVALVGNVLPFSLFAYGETRISSVLAGIWNATTPLATLPVLLLMVRDERPTRQRTAGLVLGFAGVGCLLAPWRGLGGGALVGDLACMAAAGCYGVAIPYTRRFLSPMNESALSLSAGQLLCATVELAVAMPLLGRAVGPITAAVALSVLGLGALGTGLGFVLLYRLIGLAGATVASTTTYVIPLFAAVLGIAVLGEHLGWYEPVGAVVVLAGVAVSQRQRPPTVGADSTPAAGPALASGRAAGGSL